MNIFVHRFAILTASLQIQWVQEQQMGMGALAAQRLMLWFTGDESMMKERSLRLLEGSAGC